MEQGSNPKRATGNPYPKRAEFKNKIIVEFITKDVGGLGCCSGGGSGGAPDSSPTPSNTPTSGHASEGAAGS